MPLQLVLTIPFCFLGEFLLQSLSYQFVLIINHAGIIYTFLKRNNEQRIFYSIKKYIPFQINNKQRGNL